MDTEVNNQRLVLALIIINKGEPLNNSYKLVRIFEHKFRVNPIDILKTLREKKLANFKYEKGIFYYKIAETGRQLIEREYNTSLSMLLNDYPDESEFIETLFHSFGFPRL